MNKYKALVVDFDNTLAALYTFEITNTVKSAIKNLINSGYLFTIVTGKPFVGRIEEACKELDLTTPQVVHGGAKIIEPQTGKILWEKNIADKEAQDIISYLESNGIFFTVEKDNFVYTSSGDHLKFYGNIPYKNIEELVVSNIPKIVVPSSVNKFTFEQVETITKELQSLYKDVHIIRGGIREYFGFDITHIEATKHTAILEYMKFLNLKKEEVVGVGDGYNDYPLLTACGVKVAMKDAPQELKDIADFIAPSQKNDGLLEVINKYFK